jgi:DNA-binding transcriptional LysR family regulator
MDLKDVLVFVQIVRSGSLTAAARELGMQKSSVSRKLAELEESVGARLLQRTTRALNLTDEGRVFYDHGLRAMAELEEAQAAVSGMRAAPRGLLRVTAPLAFGYLGSVVGAFLARYPEVQVELVCTDRVVDLVEEGFDLAIRAGTLPDTSLIVRKLGTLPRYLVASPDYLKRHAKPKKPDDLAAHTCLTFVSSHPLWRLSAEGRTAEVRVDGKLAANDYDLIRQAAIAGAGIALIPDLGCIDAIEAGTLVRVLPEWTSEETPVQALYPSTRHLPAKVKAFVEFLKKQMGR